MIGPSSSRSRFNSSGRPPPRPTSEPALPDRDPSGEQESPAADSKAGSRSVRKTARWIGPDEGFLGLHRRSLDLRSFPDPSRLAPPDLFAPAPASSEETGGDDPDVQVREAPGPEVRERRRAGLPARAVAAHPTAAESTSAQPASPEPAAPEPAAAEVMQSASVSIQEDGSRVIAAEPTRWMLALAHRIGAQDLQALRELAPPDLATPALVERFACFHQSTPTLSWHDIGRLMFAFVQAWQSRLTDPSWPLAWWALNSEVSRRVPRRAGRNTHEPEVGHLPRAMPLLRDRLPGPGSRRPVHGPHPVPSAQMLLGDHLGLLGCAGLGRGLPRLGRPTLAVHVDPSAGDGHRSQAR